MMAAGERASGEPRASSAVSGGLLGKSHDPRVNFLVYKMGWQYLALRLLRRWKEKKLTHGPGNSKVVTNTGSAT